MEEKRFDEWNEVKKKLDSALVPKYPSAGKIYWCSVGCNVGREVYGKGDKFRRPVLVLNAFKNGMFFGVPLSSKLKNKSGFLFYKFKDSKDREQVALFGQAKNFDTKRILQYMGKISKKELKIMREKFSQSIVGLDK